MSDVNNKPESESQQPERREYTPAPPAKRVLAWVGVVYMVIVTALTTYMYFADGNALTGLAPLLTIPGLVGLGVMVLLNHRSTGAPRKGIAWAIAVVCWLAAVWFLFPGIAGLLANFA
ncbi:MAG: hypothetical protein E7450_02285 [Ruminococcaceae bacterium]|nr:hypothetical protein [Oscillospiraceae bacterium]